MTFSLPPPALAVAAAGIVAGLAMLARGMRSYGAATRIGDTATSRIATVAAGEVRITGTVEPAGVLLVSAIQSRECVYHRSRIEESDGENERTVLHEERSTGFFVRDASSTIRLFPSAARFDVAEQFDERDGILGERPIGLALRTGPAVTAAVPDEAAAVAALLAVRPTPSWRDGRDRSGGRRRRYREARIEPGETVTVVGRALPFRDLADPMAADLWGMGLAGVAPAPGAAAFADPEIAADLAEARAAGILESEPAEAWGNAAIPGFGIGRPVRPPELEPGVRPLPVATVEEAARAERAFEIDPDELVLATDSTSELLVALGAPAVAAGRAQGRFLVGLLGAVLAIGSAVALAVMLGGPGSILP